MPRMLEVYDTETGQILRRQAVTALECVENGRGRYTLKKPDGETAAAANGARPGPSPSPSPAATTAAAAAPQPPPPDNLMKIMGIGKGLMERLHKAGYRTFESIASTSAAKISADIHSPGYSGQKIREERWIEQAEAIIRHRASDGQTPAPQTEPVPEPEPEPPMVEPAAEPEQPAPQPTEEPQPVA